MPRSTEIKSLKDLCLDDVKKAVNDFINKLLVEITDSGGNVIDLLGKREKEL